MIVWLGKKVTARQFARLKHLDALDASFSYWTEQNALAWEGMTEGEVNEVNDALTDLEERIREREDKLVRAWHAKPLVPGPEWEHLSGAFDEDE